MSSEISKADIRALATKFVPQIEQVYACTNQGIDESKLLGELLKLIDKIPEDEHLFCDETFRPVSVFCLTLFSFSNQGTVSWLKGRFDPVLSRCKACILHFTQGKCKMLQHFSVLRKVPYEHVTKFNNIVSLWRAEALLPVLRGISINNNTDVHLTEAIELALYECLCNPQVLRTNEQLKIAFDAIFKFLYNSHHTFLEIQETKGAFEHVPAGLMYCWFEGNNEEVLWAQSYIRFLRKTNFTFNKDNFTQDLLEEINVHFLYLQNSSNFHEALVSHFWSKFIPVFCLLSSSIIEEYLIVPPNLESLRQSIRHPIEPIYKLWYRHLAHLFREKPLDMLLRALKVLVEKAEGRFWVILEPFTFHSVLELIFEKNTFSNILTKLQDKDLSSNDFEALLFPTTSLTDLVSWTLPFFYSLSPSKRIQMVKKVSIAFFRIISNHQTLKTIPKACLMNSSTALLSAVLAVTEEERSMLYSNESFETVLFTKLDSRALLNNEMVLDLVVRSATDANMYPGVGQLTSSVSYSSMKVLAHCIDYDILILCQASYRLYRGEKANDVKVTTNLLSRVVQSLDLTHSQDASRLASLLLSSMQNVNGLLKPKTAGSPTNEHNSFIGVYVDLLKNLLIKITDILPSQLTKVLLDENASRGFWSCIFTSDVELYQTATNILYETFDVEGRLEGIQEMFTRSLDYSLSSVNMVLSQLIKNEFFEPCPRAIRVLMDIITAFSDPVNGIFANYKSMKNENTDRVLRKFWTLSWDFLNMIYRATLGWASKHPYSELENFTKDTLDTSLSLLDACREFSEALTPSSGADQSNDLLQNVLNTFQDMLYWLRLSDEYLLASCVKLVVRAADLAIEKELRFDDSLVATMAKYASKARKFSNKLTAQQSQELLSRAKGFNDSLVEKVVGEADFYHKEKDKIKSVKESDSQSISAQSLSTKLSNQSRPPTTESRADFLQRKAMSSSIMGRPKSQSKITSFGTLRPGVAPKAKEPLKAPTSKLELARRQLLANRTVHPPSSSVFHSRKPQPQQTNSADSSDESEGDLEDAKELFSLSKPKERSTPIVLDINGKPIQKSSSAQRKKQEEENMRRRLNVDLNPFYRDVLQWNYTNTGEYPSGSNDYKYEDIKDAFRSAEEYQRIMKPLLLLECWQGLCAARDREENKPFSIVVGNRTAVSDFYEVYASVSKRMVQEAGITDSELLVLSFIPGVRSAGDLRSDDFKTAENTCLAKVWGLKNNKGDNMDLTLRIDRSHRFSRFLTLRAEIFAVKVMQMTTVEREYTSLVGLPFYDLVGQIVSGKPTPHHPVNSGQIEDVKAKYKLNNSQAEAIVSTVSCEGFSLIQGPPGTGKTKTILGIVGYTLSTQKALPPGVIKQPLDAVASSTEQLLLKQKVLICAPSNAAVDELVLRLKLGVFDKSGRLFQPKLVRIGRPDAVNAAIRDLTLEEQVEKRLNGKNYEFASNPDLEKNLQAAIGERRQLRHKLDNEDGSAGSTLSTDDITKIQLSIRELSRKINELGKQKDEIREKNSVNFRNREVDRRKAQSRILAESDVICSTLSGSAHDIMASLGVKFDTVIVDEACQCTELSSIIPLRYGAKRCIMVGDPNQLPPTVLSGAASNFKYNQSLFVRMEKQCSPHLLNVQYRMHPAISKFPSIEFYKGKLTDGPDMETINTRPWHSRPPLGPYKFFDIATGKQEQNKKTMSFVNFEECKVAIELVEYLLNSYEKSFDFSGKIGIISPYREQMQTMRREFRRYFGNTIAGYVDFNTIDGFQGQEKEIIIISCVRADDTKSGVGFLKDFRRMNVALTRAKTSMWILGHHSSLFKNKLWRNLITDAKDRNCLELACSGFLNPQNKKAARLLKDYQNSHDHIIADDYDPLAPSTFNEKNRKNHRENGAHQNKRNKPKQQSKPERGEPKSGNAQAITGTKKKSSIFGGPSLASEISVITRAPTVHANAPKAPTKRSSDQASAKGLDKATAPKRVRFEAEAQTIGESSYIMPDSESGQASVSDAGQQSSEKISIKEYQLAASDGNTHENHADADSDQDGYDPSVSPVAKPKAAVKRENLPEEGSTKAENGIPKRSKPASNPFIPKKRKLFSSKK
ncbi:Helicase SEN1 [Lachancea thermotolerans]